MFGLAALYDFSWLGKRFIPLVTASAARQSRAALENYRYARDLTLPLPLDYNKATLLAMTAKCKAKEKPAAEMASGSFFKGQTLLAGPSFLDIKASKHRASLH